MHYMQIKYDYNKCEFDILYINIFFNFYIKTFGHQISKIYNYIIYSKAESKLSKV